ncbi:MAG: flagellar basal body rod protein FlgC [Candidatus Midichloria sp.]|uniref:Flagellar basal body rod protein FlgC n=1 Tax=Hyalomma marginatum TaxID=34627 RepID=A0A8S4BW96_9ACAR|nr:flagellar basal body rod protein FlgC [Hyalomma marginatum]CAG7597634.1 flagellar basal body rod protein FlgC [Hyalomma marginatum]
MILHAFILINLIFASLAAATEDPLVSASRIAVSGMQSQSERLKVVAQNIANAEVTGKNPLEDPYRRKIIFFTNDYDEKADTILLKIDSIREDQSEFEMRYLPEHPAADSYGFVKYPNVNKIIEMADAKEAQSSFEANAASLEITKSNQLKILELMR